MEKISVLGVDPSLRKTGLAVIEYNNEKKEFMKPKNCMVVSNPLSFKGTDAILNMLDMLEEESESKEYVDIDNAIIESPGIMFNKAWAAGTISLLAHISGGSAVIFGLERSFLFKPSEWNKSRKKDVTHNKTIALLGSPDTWHYKKRVKSEKDIEHILDAASIALWWIINNYQEEKDDEC